MDSLGQRNMSTPLEVVKVGNVFFQVEHCLLLLLMVTVKVSYSLVRPVLDL